MVTCYFKGLVPPSVLLNQFIWSFWKCLWSTCRSSEDWCLPATRCWVWRRESRAKCVSCLLQPHLWHKRSSTGGSLKKKRFRRTLFKKNTLKFHKVSLFAELRLFKVTFLTVVFLCCQFSHTKRNKRSAGHPFISEQWHIKCHNICVDSGLRLYCSARRMEDIWIHVGRWCHNFDNWRAGR